MSIFIEDPGQVIAGVTSGDQLLSGDDQCPHGFKRNITCPCFVYRSQAPTERIHCGGYQFHQHSADEVIPMTKQQ